MNHRQTTHRDKRLAEGAKPLYVLLSKEAAEELERRKIATGLSHVRLIERWLKKKSTHTAKS